MPRKRQRTSKSEASSKEYLPRIEAAKEAAARRDTERAERDAAERAELEKAKEEARRQNMKELGLKKKKPLWESPQAERAEAVKSPEAFRAHLVRCRPSLLEGLFFGETQAERWRRQLANLRLRIHSFWTMARKLPGAANQPPPALPPIDSEAAVESAVDQLLTWLNGLGRATQREQECDERQLPTIWFHGDRQYSIDRHTPLKVSEEFDNILQAFLECQAAMETSDVEEKSGVSSASRAMKSMAEWNNGIFSNALRIPKGKAKGGYFARVKSVDIP